MSVAKVSLDDKYDLEEGRALISGNQALVRLALLQADVDRRNGLNTGGYISGYRGSPLGNVDTAFWQVQSRLHDAGILFKPAVNEDLAATAIWGTQQLDNYDDPTVDGIFAMWYGKGPGVDRSGDALKHGNLYGTHRNGGVLVVYGDDHPGKSSTVAHQSELALAANSIPSLYPSNVAEIMSYGLAGWAMSRYTGLWAGLKTVNETVEQTLTVHFDALQTTYDAPEPDIYPNEGVHFQPGRYNPIRDEQLLVRYKLPLVHQFVRANGLDRVLMNNGPAALGVVTSGKAFGDVQQALELLGIDAARAMALRLSLYKVACIWPLEPAGLTDFARNCQELLFVEEKRPVVQDQAGSILYSLDERPRITGKRDDKGLLLLPADNQLYAVDVAIAIADRLEAIGLTDQQLSETVARLRDRKSRTVTLLPGASQRAPYFCSGCPHSISTRLPQGSIAGAGIGCHGMAMFYRSDTLAFTQMGGEGATWNGVSPFTRTQHVFQNLGDGTYFHSGILAIRAAVAAGVNITYKVLYNDAVAMTGGQPVDGPLSVGGIAHQVLSEGVAACVIVSDSPGSFAKSSLPKGVDVLHRDKLDAVQRKLRETPGCTVLIFEQTCAAEKRRRRKRGRMEAAPKRLFIHADVCEGCGDCTTQSNCLSIFPKDTILGRKRQIDQHSCNQDYSCLKGFCPSFVSVYGGDVRRPDAHADSGDIELPLPPTPVSGSTCSIMIAGVGGTGIITVGAMLAMAAHIEGKTATVYDMTGLAQKGGAVYGHLRIGTSQTALGSQRIGPGEADLVLGLDLLAALSGDSLPVFERGHTTLLANESVIPTAAFQVDQTLSFDCSEPLSRATALVGEKQVLHEDFGRMAVHLCGDAIAGNTMAVGYAVQRGLLPLAPESIEQAIAMNSVAVDMNLKAFRFGRQWATNPGSMNAVDNVEKPKLTTASEIAEHRYNLLVQYQNVAYADRYRRLVEQAIDADARLASGDRFSRAVARVFFQLMAYKDEYEVARLYSQPEFTRAIEQQFQGKYRLRFNLAPPLLSRRSPATGVPEKREFGGWVLPLFRLLARLRFLRGTRFDLFGITAERRKERALVAHYESLVGDLLEQLSAEVYERAVALAELPKMIRGFGHIKETSIQTYREQQAMLMEKLKATGIDKAA